MSIVFVVFFPSYDRTIPIMSMRFFSFFEINTLHQFMIPIIIDMFNTTIFLAVGKKCCVGCVGICRRWIITFRITLNDLYPANFSNCTIFLRISAMTTQAFRR